MRVRVVRTNRKKINKKPPNPRRGTSLKEKLGKAISLKKQNLFEDRRKLNQA